MSCIAKHIALFMSAVLDKPRDTPYHLRHISTHKNSKSWPHPFHRRIYWVRGFCMLNKTRIMRLQKYKYWRWWWIEHGTCRSYHRLNSGHALRLRGFVAWFRMLITATLDSICRISVAFLKWKSRLTLTNTKPETVWWWTEDERTGRQTELAWHVLHYAYSVER